MPRQRNSAAGIPPSEPVPNGMHIPGSETLRKTPQRIARMHARIANLRTNAFHSLTMMLVEPFPVMAIEDLNVAGMLKNHHRARAMGCTEVRRQIEDQAAQQGTTVILVSRWYPSNNTGSACDYQIPKIPCSVRAWTCAQGQTHHDRDINAAIHWRKVAGTSFTARPGEPWCDEPGRRRLI